MNELLKTLSEMKEPGANISITTTASELKEFGEFLIDQATQLATKRIKDGKDEVLLTLRETMVRLQVKDRTTMYRWAKRGFLLPVKSGKKCLYRLADIERILTSKAGGRIL